MRENKHKSKNKIFNHKRIGRETLFKIVPPSLAFLFFLPLLINYFLYLFGYSNRQCISEYQYLYYSIAKFDGVTLTFIVIQILALILAILIYGPKVSRRILDNDKGLYVTGLKTALVLWVWIFLSSVLTAIFFEIIKPKNDRYVIPWLIYTTIPYIIFAIIHSLSITYFIGSSIKKMGANVQNTD